MKLKTSLAVLAFASAFAAAPAFAHEYGHGDRGRDRAHELAGGPIAYDRDGDRRYSAGAVVTRDDLRRLERRIDQGAETGALTRREAVRLRVALDDLRDRMRDYWRTGGISAWENRDLSARYDRLSYAIRAQKHDDDHRRYRP